MAGILLPQWVSDGDLSERWLYQTLDITKTITSDTLSPQLYNNIFHLSASCNIFYTYLGRLLIFPTYLQVCSATMLWDVRNAMITFYLAAQSLKLPAGPHHCYSPLSSYSSYINPSNIPHIPTCTALTSRSIYHHHHHHLSELKVEPDLNDFFLFVMLDLPHTHILPTKDGQVAPSP